MGKEAEAQRGESPAKKQAAEGAEEQDTHPGCLLHSVCFSLSHPIPQTLWRSLSFCNYQRAKALHIFLEVLNVQNALFEHSEMEYFLRCTLYLSDAATLTKACHV